METANCGCCRDDLPWEGRGTNLDISGCRFSLYPMTDNFVSVILGALEKTDTSAVWSQSDALSTVYRGKLPYVADAVRALFINAWQPEVHMALEGQFSKGCPGDTDGDSLLDREGVGCICFSPLAQGALTGKYLKGIEAGTRASRAGSTLKERYLSPEKLRTVEQLSRTAEERGQTMAQMALSWVLRRGEVTSVLIGASRPAQLMENLTAMEKTTFTEEEESRIGAILEGTWKSE